MRSARTSRLFFVPLFFLVLASGAQVLAVHEWLQPSYGWVVGLFWQVWVAVLVAMAVSQPLAYRLYKPYGQIFAYTCAICLVLPVLGMLLCCAAWITHMLFPAVRARHINAASVGIPELWEQATSKNSNKRRNGISLRAEAQNYQLPDQDRISAMIALQGYSTHATAELWEGLFSDSSQNVRQFASGIIADAREAITRKISAAETELGMTAIPNDRLRLCVRLAELHWELIYQKLVRFDDHDRTLDSVVHYARNVLNLNKKHPAMWYLLGRCALLRNDPATAEEFLQQARLCHFPVERLLPWLAEAAFLQRDYDRVRVILGAVNRVSLVPTLQPIVRYWAGPRDAARSNMPSC